MHPSPERLSSRAKTVRLSVTAAVAALMMIGALAWDDDAFPFGPFRMFSTSTPPNGAMSVMALDARMPDGTWRQVPLEAKNVGINRAEVEGQDARFKAQPELLRHMVEAHDRLRPREPRWTGVRVVQEFWLLRDRAYAGKRRTVIAEWTRS